MVGCIVGNKVPVMWPQVTNVCMKIFDEGLVVAFQSFEREFLAEWDSYAQHGELMVLAGNDVDECDKINKNCGAFLNVEAELERKMSCSQIGKCVRPADRRGRVPFGWPY